MYITFLCRKSKADRNGKAPIECSIILNKERTYLSLPMRCEPEQFTMLQRQKRANWLRDYLNAVYGDLQRLVSEMVVSGQRVNVMSVKKRYLTGMDIDVYRVIDLKKEFLDIMKVRCSYPNWRKYEMAIDLFISLYDGEVSGVTNGDIMRFENLVNSRYDASTSYSYMTRLKAFFRYALNNGKISINPFFGIKVKRVEKEVEFLTEEEMKRIEELDCHGIARLERVRDLFVFQCHTGLAYSDMAGLVKDDLCECEYGYYVRKERQKTGVYYTVLIDSVALSILEKYDWILPVLSNQRYNSYLCEIGDLCCIKKPLHTHIARHSCATMLINRGMSLDSVAKVLGHSTTKVTKHYAKLLDHTVLHEMAKIV